jgi:hypothetical protein
MFASELPDDAEDSLARRKGIGINISFTAISGGEEKETELHASERRVHPSARTKES